MRGGRRVGGALAALFSVDVQHSQQEVEGALQRHSRPPEGKCKSRYIVQEAKILDPDFVTRKWTGYDAKIASFWSALCVCGG